MPLDSGILDSDILASVAILSRDSESVSAVMRMENKENRFTKALEDLQQLSHQEGIPLAIVGGLAAIRYGYPAVTQDIDIAVASDQLVALLKAAPAFGLQVAWEAESGWHTLTHGDVEINIVPEGRKAKNDAPTTIPGPRQLGVTQGLKYATLSGWIELKISSDRQKDRAHVVEVMKQSDEQSLQAARLSLAQIHPSYLILFDQRLTEAQEEKRQEKARGHK